jgi:hypothetical protein
MFILETDQIPTTTQQLTAAIEASLRKAIRLPDASTPVVITGTLPNLSSMVVDVSRGQIDPSQPLPDPTIPVDQHTGPTAESFNILGDPVSIADVALLFKLSARRVAFAYGHNTAGELVAILSEAAAGQLVVDIDKSQLDATILKVAQRLSASSGVSIVKVQPTLTSISPTEMDVLLQITARKFVTAVIRVSGRLSIDNQLVARASNLSAEGDGMVAGIAVNFIRPHLTKMNNQPLPLMAFALGKVKLRGVQVHTESGLKISAAFGSD